ncbi:DUF2975 domain-containing protein [Costertonia aggregata]|uniref:DUF2975 domain-containing protein n=1 Tax=Costertonia aggregata TaxID=343403 RepID=A0A7H9AVY0_9FLAO|nr:DUF2975 domain-containing protein [Costertonia aggregata]
MRTIGKGISIFSIIAIIFDFALSYDLLSDYKVVENRSIAYQSGYFLGHFIGHVSGILSKWFPLMILAILILIIANLLEKGSLLKEENDLTI